MGTIRHALMRPRTMLGLAALLALLATSVGVHAHEANGARVVLLGDGPIANPSKRYAIEHVTGFQTSIGKTKKPFLARFDGKVIAWSIKLAKPSKRDYICYTKGCAIKNSDQRFPGFGGPPQARISVLKPLKKGKLRYKLKAQSPLEALKPYLKKTTTFSLEKPLVIRKGQIVALSTPTWAPAIALNRIGAGSGWRASRKKKRCANHKSNKKNIDDVIAGRPQMAVGSTRVYQCAYTARLLYSATLVKKP